MNKFLFFAIIFFIILACKKNSGEATPPPPQTGELLFQSGFENDTVIPRGSDADLVGADKNFKEKNDWVRDLDNHPDIGSFNIQFHQGGDSNTRRARVIPEPAKPANHVLTFWLNDASPTQSNGRIQGNMYGNKGMKEFSQSERIFLHPDFNTVKEFSKTIHWLTIAEFWNNITWSQTVPNRFRITLGIGKTLASTDDLYFILDAEDCELFSDDSQKYTKIWAEVNKAVKVPIGKWFTMENITVPLKVNLPVSGTRARFQFSISM